MLPSLLIASLLLTAAAPQPAAAAEAAAETPKKRRVGARMGIPYANHEEAMRFADELAQSQDLDPGWSRKMVAKAQKLPVVARLMQPPPPGTPKNWAVYRSRFIDPVRIAAGVRFWQANQATLERAEKEFGVPPEIVVGIIGVETIYGQQMGDFRVLDALATLAFDFPASHPRATERQAYFRGELAQFLVLHARNRTDPLRARGSYAGAMGMPQFMPTSVAKWAVDYDGDKVIDLVHSPDDVIGSVANYFKSYGWQPGMPTHYPAAFDREKLELEALLAPDILPTFSPATLQAKGVLPDEAAQQHKGPLALVELQNGGEAPHYVLGTENFYVITRYNWSSYYAMAVIELGREVKEALEKQSLARKAS